MKKTRKVLLSCVAVVALTGAFFAGVCAVKATSIKGYNRKMILFGGNLIYDGETYVPLAESGYCEHLGDLYAITDLKQQIFEIKGQNSEDFLCLIKDGREHIYQSRKNVPVLLKNFKPTKISISDIDVIEGNQVNVTDISTINKVMSYLIDENVVAHSMIITMVKQFVLYSTFYPSIALEFQFEHDDKQNCYVTSSNGITWKIGHELMGY